jgi:transaldolase
MAMEVSVHEDTRLIEIVKGLALNGFKGSGRTEAESKERYVWLKDLETRVWLDTGDAASAEKVWSPEVDALTTNNTLVNQVVQTGSMDGLIAYAAREIRRAQPGISDKDLVIEIAFLVNAKIALGLVEKFGAHVSVELHPNLSSDIPNTLMFARRYHDIEPSRFYVKVPLTPDGFVATRILSLEGIPINFTLGFSARQNYLAARFSRPRYVNVFLGRLNSLVDENNLGEPENVGEKAALASYEAVRDLRKSRKDVFTYQIAASLRQGRQVATLAGVDVLTIPPKVAQEYLEMDIARHDVHRRTADELPVRLSPDKPVETSEVERLWQVDARFVEFVEDAVSQADRITSGRQLVDVSVRHNVNLFYDWSPGDRRAIRRKGKIPELSQWPGVPLDDLMSVSALEAFITDQTALDERIAGLVEEART